MPIGTAASESIVTRPPILHDTSVEISPVVQTWLHNCLEHHDKCRLSTRFLAAEALGAEFELPLRVISIEGDGENLVARLVKTNGLRGRYCALSHCWGSADKRPLRTTRSNLGGHLMGIPLDQFSLTFRDALALTQGLNINYLWIDSLCIVQDDNEEWLRESAKMGSIYRNATLVIVASGSADSTRGLFVDERPEPSVFRFPYVGGDGSAQGSFNDAIQSNDDRGPADGPQRKRAWALQDWYLSRRKVFFHARGYLLDV